MNETCRQFIELMTAQEARYIEALETLDEVISLSTHKLVSMEISEHITRIMNARRNAK